MSNFLHPMVKTVFEPVYTPIEESSKEVIPVDHQPVLKTIVLETKEGNFLEVPFLTNQNDSVDGSTTATLTHLIEGKPQTYHLMLKYSVVTINDKVGLVRVGDFDEHEFYIMSEDKGKDLPKEECKTLTDFFTELAQSKVLGYTIEARRNVFENSPIEI